MPRTAVPAPCSLALASRRPVLGPAAASLIMSVIAIVWLLLPPYLILGALITTTPFLGEQPGAAAQAQAAQMAMAAFALAAALPWACWWLALAQGWHRLARFWAGAGVLSACAAALIGLLAAGSAA